MTRSTKRVSVVDRIAAATPPPKSCPYCGTPMLPDVRACFAHSDLPALEQRLRGDRAKAAAAA